jgi:hypothetical protein
MLFKIVQISNIQATNHHNSCYRIFKLQMLVLHSTIKNFMRLSGIRNENKIKWIQKNKVA